MLVPAGAAVTLLVSVLLAHLAAWRWVQSQLYAFELMDVRHLAWTEAHGRRQRPAARSGKPVLRIARPAPRLVYVPMTARPVATPSPIRPSSAPRRTVRTM